MTLYNHFAQVYARGYYPEFSQALANLLPGIFTQFEIPSTGKLIDLACGEGSFALEMASKGWDVVGIDQSEEMLRLARRRAADSASQVEFFKQDMREFTVPGQADLVTCWFDSLNYLLRIEDIQSAFSRVYQALKPGGWFIFDMNTITDWPWNGRSKNAMYNRKPKICSNCIKRITILRSAWRRCGSPGSFEMTLAGKSTRKFILSGLTRLKRSKTPWSALDFHSKPALEA